MTDIIDLVLQDHHAVEQLFTKLQAAKGADDQSRLFAQVKEALERHASAEEKALYPRVRKDVPRRQGRGQGCQRGARRDPPVAPRSRRAQDGHGAVHAGGRPTGCHHQTPRRGGRD